MEEVRSPVDGDFIMSEVEAVVTELFDGETRVEGEVADDRLAGGAGEGEDKR